MEDGLGGHYPSLLNYFLQEIQAKGGHRLSCCAQWQPHWAGIQGYTKRVRKQNHKSQIWERNLQGGKEAGSEGEGSEGWEERMTRMPVIQV